jgi:hypothetical protein
VFWECNSADIFQAHCFSRPYVQLLIKLAPLIVPEDSHYLDPPSIPNTATLLSRLNPQGQTARKATRSSDLSCLNFLHSESTVGLILIKKAN